MSNLRLLNETEITSSQSSTSITDVFSADFDIYKITVNGVSTVGTTFTGLDVRFINSSGSVISASEYDYAGLEMKTDTTFGENRNTNQSLLYRGFSISTDQAPESTASVSYVFNPFDSSSYTFFLSQHFSTYHSLERAEKYIGVLTQTNSITGFQMLEVNTRPYDSGVIRTYGLRVDS